MRRFCAVLLAGAAIGLIAGAQPAGAAELTGTPVVIDGDTIELQGQTIRLHGVDAPELGQTCTIKDRPYDCGMVARTALLDLTAGTPVTCRTLDAAERAGPEGQPARCTAGGYDLSEGMAYTGWALAERTVTAHYVRVEDGARTARRGLWRGTFEAPWEWRRAAR